MGQAIYFIAGTNAIPKSSFCQNQLYSVRVTDISWETFGCQSAVILLRFQSLKGSKLTLKKKDCISNANHIDSPKRCYIPQLIPNWIKPFLLKKRQQFKACIMSLPMAVNAWSFWIYAKHILLYYLLFRQAPLLSQQHCYYSHLFLHPTANLLPCPLKSNPSKIT